MMWLEVRRALPKARTPSRGRRRPRPAQGNAAGGASLALEMRSPRVAGGLSRSRHFALAAAARANGAAVVRFRR